MDKPKIMYNPATKKMTAMEPKDDNLVNSIYNSPNPVKRVEKLVKETTPPSSIAEYNKQQQDKIKPYNHFDKSTYPSNYTPQQRARLIREAKQQQKFVKNVETIHLYKYIKCEHYQHYYPLQDRKQKYLFKYLLVINVVILIKDFNLKNNESI